MATKKSTSGKSMDIQKAGEAAPDSSGRPIIVTHRPMLQDPMMAPAGEAASSETKKEDDKQPLSQSMTSSAKTIEPPKGSETTEDKKTAEAAPEPEAEEVPEEKSPEVTDSIAPNEETAVVDAVIASAGNGSEKSETQKQEDEDAKHKQAVQVLVDSKKYFAPIGQVSRRKHNRRVITWVALLIVVAVSVFVVYTGIVSLPTEQVLNLFRQLI
jgi:hypothetical protein